MKPFGEKKAGAAQDRTPLVELQNSVRNDCKEGKQSETE